MWRCMMSVCCVKSLIKRFELPNHNNVKSLSTIFHACIFHEGEKWSIICNFSTAIPCGWLPNILVSRRIHIGLSLRETQHRTRLTLTRKIFSSRNINQIREGWKVLVLLSLSVSLRLVEILSQNCYKKSIKFCLPSTTMPILAASHPKLICRRETEDICMCRVLVHECAPKSSLLSAPPVAVHHRQIASLDYSFFSYLNFLNQITPQMHNKTC